MSITLLALTLIGSDMSESPQPSHEEIAPVTVTVQRLPDFGDPMEITQRHMEERLRARRPAEIRDLEKNRALWLEKRIRSYRFTVSSSSAAWGIRTKPTVVTIRDKQVVSAEYDTAEDSWSPTIIADIQTYDTIPKLFAIVEQMLSEPLTIVDIQYDAQYGFPSNISSDAWGATDAQSSIVISSFEVLE